MTTSTPSFDRTKAMSGPPGPGAPPAPISMAPSAMKERLLKNKPLLALGIVLLLLFTVGQFIEAPSHSRRSARGEDGDAAQQAQPQMQQQQAMAPAITPAMSAATASGLTPALATEFVTWWITKAMDYSASSSGKSHAEAFGWMTPQAAATFQQVFWTPPIAQGITQGRITAAFQPSSVQAEAINPDGSIVVGVTGSLIVQDSATPVSQQIVTDFLVKKEKGNMRVVTACTTVLCSNRIANSSALEIMPVCTCL